MTRKEFLQAFRDMSPEDQEAIRTELAALETQPACPCPPAMKQHVMEMVEKMQTSEDPAGACQEMMRMCREMMQRMAKGAASSAPS